MSGSPLRNRKNQPFAVHGGSSGLDQPGKGTSAPAALSVLVWGLSMAVISSDEVVYKLSGSLSLSRSGFLMLFCPRSPAQQKQSPHLGFSTVPYPLLSYVMKNWLFRVSNNTLKSCLKYAFSNFQDVAAGTGSGLVTLVQLQLKQSGHYYFCSYFLTEMGYSSHVCKLWRWSELYTQNHCACGIDIMNGGTGTWHHLFRNPSYS